ncbi:hypothetical protein EMIT079MI2_20462 [Bacillus sp. IT-79MI2]
MLLVKKCDLLFLETYILFEEIFFINKAIDKNKTCNYTSYNRVIKTSA